MAQKVVVDVLVSLSTSLLCIYKENLHGNVYLL